MHHAGDFQRAEELYLRILKRDPKAVDAHHYFGVLLSQHGDLQRAQAHMRSAVKLRPDNAAFQNNLGSVLEASDELEPAIEAYREAIRLETADADAHYNLALVMIRLERWSEAKESLNAAIALQADDADYHLNLGKALGALGELDSALQAYDEAARLEPNSFQAQMQRGNLLHRSGQYTQAVAAYWAGEKLRPGFAPLHCNLGLSLAELGDVPGAMAGFERALAIDPRSTASLLGLGRIARDADKPLVAAERFRQALSYEPFNVAARNCLIAVLAAQRPSSYEAPLENELLACFDSAAGDTELLARLAANQLRHKLGFDTWDSPPDGEFFGRVCTDPLLIAFLQSVINVDPVVERVLTSLRRWLLVTKADALASGEGVLPFAAALAQQCFVNEYVFGCSDEEQAALQTLAARFGDQTCADELTQPAFELDLMRYAMYDPLCGLPMAETIAKRSKKYWHPAIRNALERMLYAPLEERRLRNDIGVLTAVSDTVSEAVQQQYEEHPYPRWLRMPAARARALRDVLRQRFPHADLGLTQPGRLKVLAPGCGTGYEAIDAALCYADTDVLAVDLSNASLAYGLRMANALGVESVSFKQADILELDLLPEQFDFISCSGVLHHMREPARGWAVLERHLKPGGLMRIGLYSELGRAAIKHARELIEKSGLKPVDTDIRAFRQQIFCDEGDALLDELKHSDDMYTTSACRDLLFHVHEHNFTLPEIAQMLRDLGLEFIGFELANDGIRKGYQSMFADDPSMTSLANWHEFERQNRSCFVAMYQFWCRKPDLLANRSDGEED